MRTAIASDPRSGGSGHGRVATVDPVRAIWNGTVLAESDDTVVVEGNHYFPPESLTPGVFTASTKTSFCGWKGRAHYYNVSVGGAENPDAAWYYEDPLRPAAKIKNHVAFWRGVTVEE
jgi:uncharacterized protein (DUF427 family)